MSEPRDPLDVEPWPPGEQGKFYVGSMGSIRGPLAALRRDAREAGTDELLDFGSAPRRKLWWILFRRRFRDERSQYQADLDRWYVQARDEAGLPRLPTRTDWELARKRRGRPAHPDPEVEAALLRLQEIWDELPEPAKAFRVVDDGTIVVSIHPYRERLAQRIRDTCHPASVRVERMDIDDDLDG